MAIEITEQAKNAVLNYIRSKKYFITAKQIADDIGNYDDALDHAKAIIDALKTEGRIHVSEKGYISIKKDNLNE